MNQSTTSQVDTASPWQRIAAYFVDYFVFVLPLIGLLTLASWAFSSFDISPFSDNAWLNHGIGILVLTVPVVLYFAVSEASRFQATVGKRFMKVSVEDISGQRTTLKQTAVRAVVKFLPWEFFHTILWHWEGWAFVRH